MRFDLVVLFGALLGSTGLMLGQSSEQRKIKADRVDSTFLAFKTTLAEEEMLRVADSLRRVGRTSGDCADELAGLALYIRYAFPDHQKLEQELHRLDCAVEGYHVPYNIGARYFMLQDYHSAQTWLSRSLSAAPDHAHELRCRIALGAICSELDDRPGALEHFSRAQEIAEPPVPLMLVNNLASTQIWFELYEDALLMLDAAIERKDLTDEELALLRTNRFIALFRSNQMSEAEKEFYWLYPKLNAESISASLFINLVYYALRQEDQEVWLQLQGMLSRALETKSLTPFGTNEPCRMLFAAFEEDWNALEIEDIGDNRWRTIKGLQAAYSETMQALYSSAKDEGADSQYDKLRTDSIVATREPQNHLWTWLLCAGFAGVLAGGTFLVRRKLKNTPSEVSSVGQLIPNDSIQDHPEVLKQSLDIVRSTEKEKHLNWLRDIVASQSELTETEFQALELFVHGHSAKEAAMKLDKSLGHVYNLRTTLRKKLDMNSSDDFQNWYNNQLRSNRPS